MTCWAAAALNTSVDRFSVISAPVVATMYGPQVSRKAWSIHGVFSDHTALQAVIGMAQCTMIALLLSPSSCCHRPP